MFRQKVAVDKVFHKYQNKLKQFLLLNKKSDSVVDSFLKPDSMNAAYIDEYAAFLDFKR